MRLLLFCFMLVPVVTFSQQLKLGKPMVEDLQTGVKTALTQYSQERPLILITLGTECPICQKYAGVFQEMADAYPQFAFLGIYTGWEDTALIRPFLHDYGLRFPMAVDPRHQLIRQLKTDVTPEVFLVSQEGRVLYRGSVNNWFVGLGQYRTVVTEQYLQNAIEDYLAGRPISQPRTKAIGCVFRVRPPR